MKTKIITLVTLFLVTLGLAGIAQAGPNKHSQYKAMVDATKGNVAASSQGWKHLNKFAREKGQREGMNGTALPGGDITKYPKNFRNHY